MSEFVADVGNTRVKWGECTANGLARTAALPLDDLPAWAECLRKWSITGPTNWTLAGTHPEGRDRLATWLRSHGAHTRILDDHRQLPIRVLVDFPERVGIDRLLNAVAIVPRGVPAIVVDAGSAVTVDLIDAAGAFRGGAILPGFRLMAKSLNDYTARLPLIERPNFANPPLPGTNTKAAITAGIVYTLRGGVEQIVKKFREQVGSARVYLAGGDAELLVNLDCEPEMIGPYLTLEGIRLTVQAPP
ncbi:MAG: type III pantothenate kinase [Planctomycetes bacterium]|nr:type III pantothenate kinase [Planctomycetota bacterium]